MGKHTWDHRAVAESPSVGAGRDDAVEARRLSARLYHGVLPSPGAWGLGGCWDISCDRQQSVSAQLPTVFRGNPKWVRDRMRTVQ